MRLIMNQAQAIVGGGESAKSNLKQITIRKPELYTGEGMYIHLPEDVANLVGGEGIYYRCGNRYSIAGFHNASDKELIWFCDLVLSFEEHFSDNVVTLAWYPPESSWPFWKKDTTEEDVLNIYYEEYAND